MPSRVSEAEYVRRQLRSQKGLNARYLKTIERQREELAQLRLRAPMQDVLLVVMRLCRHNAEMLEELLDKRTEKIVTDRVSSPHIKETNL